MLEQVAQECVPIFHIKTEENNYMTPEKSVRSVLVISGSSQIHEYVKDMLPPREYNPVLYADSAGSAKRMLLSNSVDILIINTPLPDEFGIDFALDVSETRSGILILVKSELFDRTCYKVEDSGILTVAKPIQKQMFYMAIKLITATGARLEKMEEKNKSLQEKMADIRTVNRAKCLLIENMHLSETDAHYYIEKQAMDLRLSKREVAAEIIKAYEE